MMFLRLLPAVLSLLLLAAHFLRAGNMVFVLLALGLAALPLVRRPWAARVLEGALLLGAVEWLRTVFLLVDERRMLGLPYARMATILGAVAVFALVSAAVMRTKRVEAYFHAGTDTAESPGNSLVSER